MEETQHQEREAAEGDLHLVKAMARHIAEELATSKKFVSDQGASISRWLLASLLALNGGAALACLNMADKIASPILPASIFVAGIMFALLNGWMIQWQTLRSLEPITEITAYWFRVANSGERDEEQEASHESLNASLERGSELPAIPGWISAALFLVGTIALGLSTSHANGLTLSTIHPAARDSANAPAPIDRVAPSTPKVSHASQNAVIAR